MNFLNRIFRRNMVDCPRCLGKGKVELDDIKRLMMELFWLPGKCAYCNGLGKVPPDRIEKLEADFAYLTTDLSSLERHKIITGDEGAHKRAKKHKEFIQDIIKEIVYMYFIENKESAEIADYLLHKQHQYVYSDSERQELIEYVEKVIKIKRKG